MHGFEQSTLACREQDAAQLRAALGRVWQAMTARHNPDLDPLERATLLCQTRDAAIIRDAAHAVTHVGEQKWSGAARA